MTKAAQDFEFWTGEDKTLTYTITDVNSASVDMAGMTGVWVLQDEQDSGSLIRLVTGGSGVTMSGCTAIVALSGSLTSGCSLDGTYYTEISASDSNSNVSVLAWGWANIHRRAY